MTLKFSIYPVNIVSVAKELNTRITKNVCDNTRNTIIKNIVQYRKLHSTDAFTKHALITREFVRENISPINYSELSAFYSVNLVYFVFQWWIAKLSISLKIEQIHNIIDLNPNYKNNVYNSNIRIERMPAWAFIMNTGIKIYDNNLKKLDIAYCKVNFAYQGDTKILGLLFVDQISKNMHSFNFTFSDNTDTIDFAFFEKNCETPLSIHLKTVLYMILQLVQFVCREPETKVVDIVKNPKTQKYSIDVASRPRFSTVKTKTFNPINKPNIINTIKDIPVEIKDEPKIKREDSFYVPPHCQKYYVGKRKKPDGSIIPLSEREYIIKRKAGYVAGGDEDGVSKNSNTRTVLN